eukprot:9383383-Pyramimonas_sp.AAC.1
MGCCARVRWIPLRKGFFAGPPRWRWPRLGDAGCEAEASAGHGAGARAGAAPGAAVRAEGRPPEP